VDEALRRLIHDGAGEQTMLAHLRASSPAIDEHGRQRVLAGETSLEEVLRVTTWA